MVIVGRIVDFVVSYWPTATQLPGDVHATPFKTPLAPAKAFEGMAIVWERLQLPDTSVSIRAWEYPVDL